MSKKLIHLSNEMTSLNNDDQKTTELRVLQEQAEREGKPDFFYFTDQDVLHAFLHEKKNINEGANRTERTIREYEKELRFMVRYMIETIPLMEEGFHIKEDSFFKSLEKRHMRRFQEWVAQESPFAVKNGGYSPATLERKTAIWKSFFAYAYQAGYIEKPLHEALLAASVRAEDRPNRDLGPRDVMVLLDYFKDRQPFVFALIHVLVGTGMRNEELCRLRVSDIQYDSILGGYYASVLGKRSKRREIPLKPKVVESIQLYRQLRFQPIDFPNQSDEPLFTTSTGRAFKPDGLAHFLKKHIQSADLPLIRSGHIKITAHVFRHSFAIISHMNKADVFSIMKALGHENIHTTQIYLQKVLDREQHVLHQWENGVLGEYI